MSIEITLDPEEAAYLLILLCKHKDRSAEGVLDVHRRIQEKLFIEYLQWGDCTNTTFKLMDSIRDSMERLIS